MEFFISEFFENIGESLYKMKTLFLKYLYLKTTILFLDEFTSEAKIWSQFPFPWYSQMSPWDFFYFAFSLKN